MEIEATIIVLKLHVRYAKIALTFVVEPGVLEINASNQTNTSALQQ